MSQLGERYTHSILAESASTAAQSEASDPSSVLSCDYPLSIDSLQNMRPGAERQMNMGATYAEIHGGGLAFDPSGGTQETVIWQQGDPARANAVADFISSTFISTYYSYYFFGAPFGPIQRMFLPGGLSPYTLHQYMDIETRHLPGGTSLRNGTVCSTFNAQAYALSQPPPPPVQPFPYDPLVTRNAAQAMYSAVFDRCMNRVLRGLPYLWAEFACGGPGALCAPAANMVMNCFVSGNCGDNSGAWGTVLDGTTSAYSISPDRLGAKTRFVGDFQTSWSRDPVVHPLQWTAAGATWGCFRE